MREEKGVIIEQQAASSLNSNYLPDCLFRYQLFLLLEVLFNNNGKNITLDPTGMLVFILPRRYLMEKSLADCNSIIEPDEKVWNRLTPERIKSLSPIMR